MHWNYSDRIRIALLPNNTGMMLAMQTTGSAVQLNQQNNSVGTYIRCILVKRAYH